MNVALHSQVTVAEPLTGAAGSGRQEPIRRQRHDEHAGRADRAADDYHSVGRNSLGERADKGDEKYDDPAVDVRELPDRRVRPQLAIAEFRKDVIDLEKDRFEESDEEKENKNAGKCRLAEQAFEKLNGFGCATLHRPRDAAEER